MTESDNNQAPMNEAAVNAEAAANVAAQPVPVVPAAPVDIADAIFAQPEFSPAALAAAGDKATVDAEVVAKTNAPLRKLDPNNPRDKFILDIVGDPASVVIFGEMKTGKTTMLAKACKNYLWIVHSKKVLRAYANLMRKHPELPALKFMVVPETRRDPVTGAITKVNVYNTLTGLIAKYNEIQKRWGIDGLCIVEITQFMKMIDAETRDINLHPEFWPLKKDEKTHQTENVYNFFAAGDWMMRFLLYLLRAVPSQIGAHVVMEANRREPKFSEKTGMRKGGAEFLTENQAVTAGHEADFNWEVRHCKDRAVDPVTGELEFKVEIATKGDDLWKRGGRDGTLCDPVEPGDLAALMVKVGLHFEDE